MSRQDEVQSPTDVFLRQYYLVSGSTIVGSSCRTLSREGTQLSFTPLGLCEMDCKPAGRRGASCFFT